MISILKAIVSRLSSFPALGRADIVISGKSGKIVLPVVPGDLPAVSNPQNNEVFKTVLGDIQIIGTLGLREISFDNFLAPAFPLKYSWANPMGASGMEIVKFFKQSQESYEPIRITITHMNGSVYLNMACLIESFDYYTDNVKDVHYSAKFKEYRKENSTGGLVS